MVPSRALLYLAISASSLAAFAGAPPAQTTWTLDDVRKLALEQNPDLKSAKANYEAATKTIGEAVSIYLPQVGSFARYDQTTLPSPGLGSVQFLGVATPYTMATTTLTWTLFDFGQGLSQISANHATANAAEQDAIALRNLIELATEKAFYGVLSASKLVDVAKKGVAQYEEVVRRTALMVKTGVRPSFDLTQANVNLGQAKLTLINANNAYEISKITLLNIMGIAKQLPFTLQESDGNSSVPSDKLQLDRLTEKAFKFRPELASREYSVESARSALHGQVEGFLPTLGAQGWYGTFLPNYPDSVRTAWGVGVFASWNLTFGNYFRAGELSSRLDQQEALRESEQDSISAEVARAYAYLLRSESNLKVANEQLEFAKENSDLAHKRFAANVGTILELLIAEANLINAEAVQVQAHYQYITSVATLKTVVNAPLLD